MSEAERPDPDALLAQMRREEVEASRGKLKIFFGMSPGVGKTFAMLQAARQKQAEGVDLQYGIHVAGAWGGKWRLTVKDGKMTYEPENGNFEGCDALFFFPTVQEEVLTFFGRFPGGAAQGDPAAIEKIRHLYFPF